MVIQTRSQNARKDADKWRNEYKGLYTTHGIAKQDAWLVVSKRNFITNTSREFIERVPGGTE